MAEKRERIVEATCDLLEQQGYHATGLSQILEQSGAPRGSLYHYFPGGKEELAAEAIERTGKLLSDRIRTHLAREADPALAIRSFIERIADGVEATEYRTGGPLIAVAMETATSSEALNAACRQAFGRVESSFAEYMEQARVRGDAADLARLITAAIEGGIVLSRTYHSGDPLRTVARLVSEWVNLKVTAE